jgi:protein-tyrosine phosphatase
MEKFNVTPSQINHNEKPAFNASWFSGEIKAPVNSHNSFYYEGSGENDALLIYKIEWQDETPDQESFNNLMDEAISAIDNWISERF